MKWFFSEFSEPSKLPRNTSNTLHIMGIKVLTSVCLAQWRVATQTQNNI